MTHQEVWFGEYKGINWEIKKTELIGSPFGTEAWTFYLLLFKEMFPEAEWPTIMPKTYYTAWGTKIDHYRGSLSDLEWHGSITYSKNETTPGDPFTYLKFGCDYQHLYDQNINYDFDFVKREVEECIDSLLKKFPNLKLRKELSEEWSKKFPRGEAGEHRTFDINGKPIDVIDVEF